MLSSQKETPIWVRSSKNRTLTSETSIVYDIEVSGKKLIILEFEAPDKFWEVHLLDLESTASIGRSRLFVKNQTQQIFGLISKIYMYHVYRQRSIRFFGSTKEDTRKYLRIMKYLLNKNRIENYEVIEKSNHVDTQGEKFDSAVECKPMMKPTFKI